MSILFKLKSLNYRGIYSRPGDEGFLCLLSDSKFNVSEAHRGSERCGQIILERGNQETASATQNMLLRSVSVRTPAFMEVVIRRCSSSRFGTFML